MMTGLERPPDLGSRALVMLTRQGRRRALLRHLPVDAAPVWVDFDRRFAGLDLGMHPGHFVVGIGHACTRLNIDLGPDAERVPCIWAGHDQLWWLDRADRMHLRDVIGMPSTLDMGRADVVVERLVRALVRQRGWTTFELDGSAGDSAASVLGATIDTAPTDEAESWWFTEHIDIVERLDLSARCEALWDDEVEAAIGRVTEVRCRDGDVESDAVARLLSTVGPVRARLGGGTWSTLDDLWA